MYVKAQPAGLVNHHINKVKENPACCMCKSSILKAANCEEPSGYYANFWIG
jgi:hypothetical protein